jgi:hypothetical protein
VIALDRVLDSVEQFLLVEWFGEELIAHRLALY